VDIFTIAKIRNDEGSGKEEPVIPFTIDGIELTLRYLIYLVSLRAL